MMTCCLVTLWSLTSHHSNVALFQTLSHFFAQCGYWVIFFGVMLENGGLPVPGETVLLFAGFLAYHRRIHLARAILTAIAGATIGDSLGFYLGWRGGTALVKKFKFLVSGRRFDRAQALLMRYGHWAVFVGRFITGLRVLAGPFAGALRMPYPRFMLFNFSGAVVWAITIGCIGFIFGSSWERLVHFVKEFDWLVLAAFAVAVLALAYLKRRGQGRVVSDK